jgi:hypothetical protein
MVMKAKMCTLCVCKGATFKKSGHVKGKHGSKGIWHWLWLMLLYWMFDAERLGVVMCVVLLEEVIVGVCATGVWIWQQHTS